MEDQLNLEEDHIKGETEYLDEPHDNLEGHVSQGNENSQEMGLTSEQRILFWILGYASAHKSYAMKAITHCIGFSDLVVLPPPTGKSEKDYIEFSRWIMTVIMDIVEGENFEKFHHSIAGFDKVVPPDRPGRDTTLHDLRAHTILYHLKKDPTIKFEELNVQLAGTIENEAHLFKQLSIDLMEKQSSIDAIYDLKQFKVDFLNFVEQVKSDLPPPFLGELEHTYSSGYSLTPAKREYEDAKGERPRRQKRYFSPEEVEYLFQGIARFGLGNWSQILRNFAFNKRTSVDLKDKWRNITKRNPEDSEARVREIQMRLNIVDSEDVNLDVHTAVAVDALPVLPPNGALSHEGLDPFQDDGTSTEQTLASSEDTTLHHPIVQQLVEDSPVEPKKKAKKRRKSKSRQ